MLGKPSILIVSLEKNDLLEIQAENLYLRGNLYGRGERLAPPRRSSFPLIVQHSIGHSVYGRVEGVERKIT